MMKTTDAKNHVERVVTSAQLRDAQQYCGLTVDPDRNSGYKVLQDFAFTRSKLSSCLRSNGIPVIPAVDSKDPIFSDDPRLIRFKRQLVEKTMQFEPHIDEHGFADHNGITKDFSALLTVAGYKAAPLSVSMIDNVVLAQELKLAPNFITARDRDIFASVHKCMFEEIRATNLAVRKKANSGFIHLTTDPLEKQGLIFHYLDHFVDRSSLRSPQAKKLKPIATCLKDKDYSALLVDHQSILINRAGLRCQADGATTTDGVNFTPKSRQANTLEFALSAGRRGYRFDVDKSLRPRGRISIDDEGFVRRIGDAIPNCFASRTRLVWGAPVAPNYYLKAFFTLFREYYLNEYDFTWKHREPDQTIEKIKRYRHMIGVDVKAFDTTIQPWLIDFFLSKFDTVLDQSVIGLMSHLFHMPFFQSSLNPTSDGTKVDGFLIGDPLNGDDFRVCMGLPSGIACNPDFGKWIATSTYLCLFDRYFNDVMEVGVNVILKGEHPNYGLLNMSDDCVLMSNDDKFSQWLNAFIEQEESFYLRIEIEKGVEFLGTVYFKDKSNELQWSPQISSMFVNDLSAREHSVEAKHVKPFYSIGFQDRIAHYGKAPLFDQVYDIADQLYFDCFGESYAARSSWLLDHPEPILLDLVPQTPIDREVLADPSKISWKFQPSEISPHILAHFASSITFETFYPLISKLITHRGI